MKNRKASDSSSVTTTAHPDLGASAPLPANPEKANVNDNSLSKTSAGAERQTYWTSDRYGWLLIVNGEMRARVEGPKVILLTHRDTKPRRLIAPNSQLPFDVAERLIGIPRVDRSKIVDYRSSLPPRARCKSAPRRLSANACRKTVSYGTT